MLQLLITLTRDGVVIAAFQSTHDKFHRYHEDCLRLATSVVSDDEALDELLQTLDAYAALFNEHHQAEDDYLFPALRQAERALNSVVDELSHQHEQLAAQLVVVLEQAHRVQSGNVQRDDVRALIEELRMLQAAVEEHLRFEEATTVPVVGSWRSWPL